ncbi:MULTISPECIES: molybdopterin-dependent oxidoreductase [unclassified Nocardioides]|uniref:molybdopterin-dependent oxidoreductase n=1 Tax=unclassified Nocardioides TaxID=2615069 RepID=UPI000702EB74|nr:MULTISPECIES: molybdopterin-dependent oxidoreductase [unclassified Nocardioides]KRC51396.1 oxidoreductase [Nocardioides sp. Root79]KRC69006.1 oxidoreductase [Nocardioides sp. Root240]
MRTSRTWWALSGLVAGAVGLGLSYAAAALLHVRESPVVAVAEGVTALTPGSVVKWAINTFDRDDKKVLVVGILVVLAVTFALLGRSARRRWWAAVTGYVVLAAVAFVAVASKPTPKVTDFAPVVVGLVAWVVTLAVLAEWLRRWELVEDGEDPAVEPTHTRRHFFVAVGGAAALAAAGGLVGRIAGSARRRAEESRRLLRIEGVTAPAVPNGAELDIERIVPWQTPSNNFYLIDTAFIKPTIEPADWSLRIHGMVENEITLTYADLVAREITEDWITLNCVSNPVGGELIGNAWWSGFLLSPLLAEARPLAGADAVLQTSDDGWTCLTPLAAMTDRSRNAMLAVAMNGEPLPIEHGFPVRTLVPGLYGYVSATKWVVDMEVTRFGEAAGYWTDKGWSEQGPVKLSSRIDVPHDGDDVAAGELVVAGSAWLQHTGVARVEVQVDGGPWQEAQLATAVNTDTWVQWRRVVEVEEGEHQLRVRATDRDGRVQTGVVADVLPDGATGWHTIDVNAKG